MATLSPFIAASADDGMVRGLSSASFPPAYSNTSDSGTWMRVQNAFAGGLYFYNNILMRWDTSALTNGATISSAVLHLFPRTANFSDADSRHLFGEWYSWTPSMGSGNYSTTPASTAFDVTVASLTKDADNPITLTNPDANISKTGYTGLRLYISGADPPGNNVVEFSDYDNTTNIPQLVITYVVASGIGLPASRTPGLTGPRSLRPAIQGTLGLPPPVTILGLADHQPTTRSPYFTGPRSFRRTEFGQADPLPVLAAPGAEAPTSRSPLFTGPRSLRPTPSGVIPIPIFTGSVTASLVIPFPSYYLSVDFPMYSAPNPPFPTYRAVRTYSGN